MQTTMPWHTATLRPSSQRPWITYALMLSVCLVMLIETIIARQGASLQAFTLSHGLVSSEFSVFDPRTWITLVTFNFLHAGSHHFAVNAYVMLVAGIAVERHAGRGATLFIWLAGGVVSGIAHLVVFPDADKALIGASGAISALLGAAMIIGWQWGLPVKLRRGGRTFFRIRLPVVIGIWAALQVYGIFNLVNGSITNPTVATWVHVAGLAFGIASAGALLLIRQRRQNASDTGQGAAERLLPNDT